MLTLCMCKSVTLILAPLSVFSAHFRLWLVASVNENLHWPIKSTHTSDTLSNALLAVFGAHPRLWLVASMNHDLRGPIESLIARTVTHDVMKVSPEVGG